MDNVQNYFLFFTTPLQPLMILHLPFPFLNFLLSFSDDLAIVISAHLTTMKLNPHISGDLSI